jgi:hypothetical protein
LKLRQPLRGSGYFCDDHFGYKKINIVAKLAKKIGAYGFSLKK